MSLQGKKIGFIGAGAMAEALLTGIVKAGLTQPENLCASDVSQERLAHLTDKLGVRKVESNNQLSTESEIIILAVKPQVVSGVLEDIRQVVKPGQVVVSIAAGITISTMEAILGQPVAVVRVMPNTPCLVGAGASALALGTHAGFAEESAVSAILGAVGKVVTIKENLLDSVTGLSGSGPAYMYVILEAFADAGVKVGLPRDVALTLAAQTMLGAAKMVLETGEHPGKLKDMVTTPGGTTINGLYALEKGNLRYTLMKAVKKAAERSAEMSKQV
ncbi:MAG: pyrroline-5-carboxylate reductase [Clostridia bacterium]|nr:pyrroline-5-carboxylate reductase [Clostridia bacterium]